MKPSVYWPTSAHELWVVMERATRAVRRSFLSRVAEMRASCRELGVESPLLQSERRKLGWLLEELQV